VTACGDYRAELQQIELGRLGLQRGRQSLPHVGRVTTPADRSLILFHSSADEAPAGAGKIEVHPGDIILSPEESQDYYRLTWNTGWASLSSPPIDFAIAAQVLGGSDLFQAGRSRIRRPPTPLMARLRTLHKAVGDLVTSAPEVLVRPEVVKALEESLIRVAIACLSGLSSSERHSAGRCDMAIMRRLERVLEASEQQPLYLTELCAKVGVSARVLRTHCQQHLGMSPHRYLWLRRMHLARRALTVADPAHATVTGIANDHGFGELGRFAVTYRTLFGESPSAALSRPPDARRPETA
jgi:AraC-like DNA-binding protein